MPIHLDSHDRDPGLTPGTPESDIAAFLHQYSEYAFTVGEIADYLDIPVGTVEECLDRLHGKGLVRVPVDEFHCVVEYREDLDRYIAELDAEFGGLEEYPGSR